MTGPRVVTLGETMALLRAEDTGSLAHVDRLRVGVGGAESNVAIALARLGTDVTWLGRVGADGLGARVIRELRGEGVDVVAVVDDTAPTGLMLKERRTDDITRVLYYRAGSAGSRLSATDLPAAHIDTASLLHVSGITPALSSTASDAVFAALDIATASGIPVSFDVNHRASLWRDRDAAEVYRRIAARSAIVFAGLDEARLLLGQDASAAPAAARAIAELGPAQVVIKLGADGCVALIDGVLHEVPARPVRVVDTVGAGDAFVAGYLAELLAGLPAEARLATAVTTGAFACLSAGDWEGYPRRDEFGLLDPASDPVVR